MGSFAWLSVKITPRRPIIRSYRSACSAFSAKLVVSHIEIMSVCSQSHGVSVTWMIGSTGDVLITSKLRSSSVIGSKQHSQHDSQRSTTSRTCGEFDIPSTLWEHPAKLWNSPSMNIGYSVGKLANGGAFSRL